MLNFPQFTISTNDGSAATEGAESFFSQHVSTPAKPNFCKRLRMIALLGVCMAPCLMSYGQTQFYAEYPQTRGKVEPWKVEDLPSWLSLDGQVRLRTEDFTSYDYVPGNDRIYELTRVYGGLTVRPTSFLTGYMQFIDAHALGLPVDSVAGNMRDTFDLRQGYLEYHNENNNVRLYAGRKELRFGNERVVGISTLVTRPTRTASMSSAPRLLRFIPLRSTRTGQDLPFMAPMGPSVRGFQIPCSSRLFWSGPCRV